MSTTKAPTKAPRTLQDVLNDIQALNEELKAVPNKPVMYAKERLATLKLEMDTMKQIEQNERSERQREASDELNKTFPHVDFKM